MDFVEMLSDSSKRRKLLGGFAALLTLAVACAGLGIALDIASLTVLAVVLLAGLVGVAGKVLSAIAVYLHGTTRRLKVLNDRYDDTEVWLEQFDKGTRATFTNLLKSIKDAKESRDELERLISSLREDYRSDSEQLGEALRDRATREALDAAVKSSDARAAKLAETVERFGQDLAKVTSGQSASAKRFDEAIAQTGELARQFKLLQEAGERLEASLQSTETTLNERVSEQDRLRKAGLQTAMKEALDSARQEIAKSTERIEVIDRNLKNASSLTGRLRGEGYAQFGRLISANFMKEVQGDLGKKLGIEVSQKELRYLERKVQHIEALCEGRLATTAEDAVARVLAARSQQRDELNVLEIGVLFGVGAAFMHMALSPFYKRVHFVLLDPFDGYYGPEHLDPLTGQKVSREAVERNLSRASIRREDVSILEGFSTDDQLLAQAKKQGPYDVIVIDGDHTYKGVEADYQRYAELVAPGGILIVDDYGSDDWPDVTKFVDAVVMSDDRFERVGTLSRTAIFRRQSAPSGSSKKAKQSEVSSSKGDSAADAKPKAAAPKTAQRSKKKPAPKKAPSKEESSEPVVVETRSAKKPQKAKARAKAGAGAEAGTSDGTKR